MTYEAFLDALRATPRDWTFGPEGQLRIYTPYLCACPISATVQFPTIWAHCHVNHLATRAGLEDATWKAIARAADCLPGCNPHIRRDLIEACGLTRHLQ